MLRILARTTNSDDRLSAAAAAAAAQPMLEPEPPVRCTSLSTRIFGWWRLMRRGARPRAIETTEDGYPRPRIDLEL